MPVGEGLSLCLIDVERPVSWAGHPGLHETGKANRALDEHPYCPLSHCGFVHSTPPAVPGPSSLSFLGPGGRINSLPLKLLSSGNSMVGTGNKLSQG